jgi:hypothetical protein
MNGDCNKGKKKFTMLSEEKKSCTHASRDVKNNFKQGFC